MREKLAKIRKNFAISWSLWEQAWPVAVSTVWSIAAYGVGLWLSSSESSEPLARAGSAATAFTIAFSVFSHRDVLLRKKDAASNTFKKVTQNLPLTGQKSQKQIESKLEKNTIKLSQFIVITESVLLVLATFVWGFGDLAKCLM